MSALSHIMISTEQFLQQLEDREILSAKLMASLRDQIDASAKPIGAETIAKKLVKAGKLDPEDAKELLRDVEEAPAAADDDDLMELAPIDDEEAKAKKARSRRREPAPEPKPKPKPEPKPEPEAEKEAAEADAAPEPPKPEKKPDAPKPPPVANGAGSLEAAAAETETQRSLDTKARKKSLGKMLGFGGRRGLRRKKKVAPGTSVWDTKLMLIGGGALLTIFIIMGTLYWVFKSESGDEMIKLADEDYGKSSYAQAINKYDQFLRKYSSHDKASFARVRRGLARMRQSNGTGNWPMALDTAKEVLPEMRQEEAFKDHRDDLRGILQKITEGLSKQAQELAMAEKPEAEERVKQTRESLELMEKNILKSKRPLALIEDVDARLALAERQIAKDAELNKTVEGIRESIEQKKVSDAYVARDALLKKYPDLVGHEKLEKAVLEIAEAEKAAVEWKAEAKQPAEPPAPMPAVSLVKRTVEAEPAGAKEKTVFASVEGALYGLDAADGKVLWRRWIGLESNPRRIPFQPVSITGKPGGDCLVYDTASASLIRIAASSGNVVWQQELELRVDAPATISGKQLYVASREGRLVEVAAESGVQAGYFKMPQALSVPPTIETKSQRLYQAADHSNLYVIDLTDKTCKDVIHLGHAKGGITTAPVVVSRFLILADNAGARHCDLRVFAMTPGAKEGELKPLQSIKLDGHVDRRPIVNGAKFLVTTDVGATYVFQITGDNEKAPLQTAATAQGSGSEPLTRYCLLRGSSLWVGDAALTCFDIQSSRGDLKWKWTACENSVFTQPLVVIGDTVFSVRRRRGIPGGVVAATTMSEPKLLWETDLGVAPAGRPSLNRDGTSLEIATAGGALFNVPLDLVGKTAVVDDMVGAVPVVQVKKAISGVCRFPDGTVALSFGAGSNQISVFDPGATPKRFRPQDLPGTLACDPVVFRGGLVVPTREGQVYLINPRNGDKLVEPFQPAVAAGTEPNWQKPAVLGDEALLLSDGATMLYRLVVADEPKPHLTPDNETAVGRPIARPLAALAKFAVAVDTSGTLTVLALPALKTAVEETLGGRCAFGPVRVGEIVLVQSSTGELFCIDDEGKIRWKKMLEDGTPIDVADVEGSPWIALMGGDILQLDAATGEVKNRMKINRPLRAIISAGSRPVLIGQDGSVLPVSDGQ